MKTTEERRKDKDGYLILPTVFYSKGFDYELVERTGDFAIYTQTGRICKSTSWIPFVVQKHEAYEIANNKVEAKEAMPRDELWGTFAYTSCSLEAARIRLKDLQKYVKKLEKQNDK